MSPLMIGIKISSAKLVFPFLRTRVYFCNYIYIPPFLGLKSNALVLRLCKEETLECSQILRTWLISSHKLNDQNL
jgi:hypothetical protein